MATIKTEAIILSASDYSESSRLLSLLTPDEGRVRLVAKGVRGPKSQFRGSVEPMSHVEVRFSLKDPHGLGTLAESRQIDAAEYLRGDLAKYACASVIVEIIDRSAHGGEGHEAAFAILRDYLRDLRDAVRAEDLTVRALAGLLSALGFQPQTARCTSCGREAKAAAFSVGSGGVVCAGCRPQLADTIPFDAGLQQALGVLTAGGAEKAARLKLTPDQSRRLLNVLLDLAQHHLEIRLNSRVFLTGLLKKASR